MISLNKVRNQVPVSEFIAIDMSQENKEPAMVNTHDGVWSYDSNKKNIKIGGTANVFLGFDLERNMPVVFKLGRHELCAREHLQGRFTLDQLMMIEFVILNEFDHPNIVKEFAYDQYISPEGLIIPIVEQEQVLHPADLSLEYLKSLSVEERFNVFKQMSSAVDYVHSKGWLQCDVSPYNFLINDQTKEIKMFDFLFARRIEDKGKRNYHIEGLYDGGNTGRAGFCPLSMYRSPNWDVLSERWAFVATIFFLMRGNTPFGGSTNDEKVYLMFNDSDILTFCDMPNSGYPIEVCEVLDMYFHKVFKENMDLNNCKCEDIVNKIENIVKGKLKKEDLK